MRVLIADDSAVYRSRITAALKGAPWLEVVGAVNNGKLALDTIQQKAVDLLILDMEMPVMDGLTTLREMRRLTQKPRVIVFSSTTVQGSEATLDALAAGADDFVTKPSGEATAGEPPEKRIAAELLPKVRQFLRNLPPRSEAAKPVERRDLSVFQPSAIVIASSTGGPAAHDILFSGLTGRLRCPIFIAQHMPPVFTYTFAKRLAACSGLPCKEALHGETVSNSIYIAPGDYHLTVARGPTGVRTLLDQSAPRNFVRPAADPLFESATEVYGGKLMSIVLTGMGEDGLRGVQRVRAAEGGVMIQSEASCVVFGMPGAVFASGTYDEIGDLQRIQERLKRMALA